VDAHLPGLTTTQIAKRGKCFWLKREYPNVENVLTEIEEIKRKRSNGIFVGSGDQGPAL
jgi:hypothetical protein